MKRLEVSDLQSANEFRLLDEISHENLLPFIGEYYWRRRSWVVVSHYIFSLSIVAWCIFTGTRAGYDWSRWLETFGFAVIAFILIVPLHEAVHGFAYKLIGASDVRFSVSIRKFYAYAIADEFVADGAQIAWVAAVPFLIINTVLAGIVLVSDSYALFAVFLLLIHTGGTSGDWAILNYLWLNRGKEVYTYDDAINRKSYFYERVRS